MFKRTLLTFLVLAVAPAFGQIDPSIPLRGVPVQIQNPMEMYMRAQQLRNLQLQNQQLQLQNAEILRARQAAVQPVPSPVAPLPTPAVQPVPWPVIPPPAPKQPEATAADTSMQRTRGACNGRWWLVRRSDDERYGYLTGLVDALAAVDDDKLLLLVTPKQLSWGEAIKAISMFYQDPLNGPLPVLAALQMVKLKAEGGTAADVEAGIASWRRTIADYEAKVSK